MQIQKNSIFNSKFQQEIDNKTKNYKKLTDTQSILK